MLVENNTESSFEFESRLRDHIQSSIPYLPEQAPLHMLVADNMLKGFLHRPFVRAVEEISLCLDGEPYLQESEYAACLRNGRLTDRVLDEVLARNCSKADYEPLFPTGPSRYEIRLQMLLKPPPFFSPEIVAWRVAETNELSQFREDAGYADGQRASDAKKVLVPLWRVIDEFDVALQASEPPVRPRDLLFTLYGLDPDRLVHPFLIKFTAAYLDQGLAYWQFPLREESFITAFCKFFSLPLHITAPWQKLLAVDVKSFLSAKLTAPQIIEAVFQRLEVPTSLEGELIFKTLIALRGWAGMVYQFERRPDRLRFARPPATLIDYLAVQLLLDYHAASHTLRMSGVTEGSLNILSLRRKFLDDFSESAEKRKGEKSLKYQAFHVAQSLGLSAESFFNPHNLERFIKEIQDFHSLLRRRILHQAYERQHKIQILDALQLHSSAHPREKLRTEYQAIFCVDDREESLRRHLEEVLPTCQTYGFAGFFGVAMMFQGIDDIYPYPLCPANIQPEHYVKEVPSEPFNSRRKATFARWLAIPQYWLLHGSKSVFFGAIAAQIVGLFSLLPLVLRCLWPRLYHQLELLFKQELDKRQSSKLLLLRQDGEEKKDGFYHGFTITEMAQIVLRMLTTTGLMNEIAPLVLVVGHGSSSLNNPMQCFYDCGATGGGKGGPNARAFAAMANDREVRRVLKERGVSIPEKCWFVGAFHNTCDDTFTFFEEELIPELLLPRFEYLKQCLSQACMNDAHERIRRFDIAPGGLSQQTALEFVEQHAHDLAEARPEYGHASNAILVVGPRSLTRGLFLDRRAFLFSYESELDAWGETLAGVLSAIGPVLSGINLAYYFSRVDPVHYGSGTKLPHNVTGLIGVMDGHSSDLRCGLPTQGVEIHEPLRLLTIVEAELQVIESIIERYEDIKNLFVNEWSQLIVRNQRDGEIWILRDGSFVKHSVYCDKLGTAPSSVSHYDKHSENLPYVYIDVDCM